MSRRKALRDDNRGAALIVVLCVIAILLVLCSALLLSASSTLGTAENRVIDERCRAMASTFSNQVEKAILDEDIQVALGQYEAGLDSGNVNVNDTMQRFLRETMYSSALALKNGTSPDWKYYNEAAEGSDFEEAEESYKEGFYKTYDISGTWQADGYVMSMKMNWMADRTDLEEAITEEIKQEEPEGTRFSNGNVRLKVTVECAKDGRKFTAVKRFSLETDLREFYPTPDEDPVKFAVWSWRKGDNG